MRQQTIENVEFSDEAYYNLDIYKWKLQRFLCNVT